MKLNMYCIYDKKSQAYQMPVSFINEEVMRRGYGIKFREASLVSSYPSDYEVYKVGIFNDVTGEVVAVKAEFICPVGDIIKQDYIFQGKFKEYLESAKEKI